MNEIMKEQIAPLATFKPYDSGVKRLAMFILNTAFVGDVTDGGPTALKHVSGVTAHFDSDEYLDFETHDFKGLVEMSGGEAHCFLTASKIIDDRYNQKIYDVGVNYGGSWVVRAEMTKDKRVGEIVEKDVWWTQDRKVYKDVVQSVQAFRKKLKA